MARQSRRRNLRGNDVPADLRKAIQQRNAAFAAAILALLIAFCLAMNNFWEERQAWIQEVKDMRAVQRELSEVQAALQANQRRLLQRESALRAAELAARNPPPSQ